MAFFPASLSVLRSDSTDRLSSPTVPLRTAKDLQLPKVSPVYPQSVAAIKRHDQKQLKEERIFILANASRGIQSITVGRAWHGGRNRNVLITFYLHTEAERRGGGERGRIEREVTGFHSPSVKQI